jgi:hypothetical protein
VEEAVSGVGQVTGDLRHPRLVRLTRDPRDLYREGPELHDKEDDVADQSAKGQHFDGERVGSRETVPVSREERLPRRLRAALRCGGDTVVLEDRFDRVAGNLVAEAVMCLFSVD